MDVKLHQLRKSFKKHLSNYNNAKEIDISERLLLFYAVENGLKFVILKRLKRNSSKEVENITDVKVFFKGSTGHDIDRMLKYLKSPSYLYLKQKADHLNSSDLHLYWRYGVELPSPTIEKELEKKLREISQWIEGEI